MDLQINLLSVRRRNLARIIVGILSTTLHFSGLRADDKPAQEPAPSKPVIVDEDGNPVERLVPKTQESAEAKQREESLSWYMSGRTMLSRGENQEALKAFRKAIEADPAALPPYQAAIPILLNDQKIEEARQLALNAAKHGSSGFELVGTMAAVLAQRNDVAGSISLLRSAREIPSLVAESEVDYRLSRDLGLYHRLNNEFDLAAVEYERVLKAIQNEVFDKETTTRILRDPGATLDEFGDTFIRAQKPELALAAYDEANKYREAKPGLHSYNLAMVFQQTGKSEQALEELDKYLNAQVQGRGRAAYELLAEILKSLEKSDELLPRLEKLLEADSRNDFLRYYLADSYVDADRLEEAAKLYQGDSNQVRDPRALVGLFSIARRQGNVEQILVLMSTTMQNVPRADDDAVLQRLAPDIQILSKRFEAELTSLKEDEGLFTELLDAVRNQRMKDESKLDFFQVYTLGKLSIEAERSDDALEFYRLAIAMRNDPPSLLFSEPALHLLDAKKYEQASQLLREGISHPSGRLQSDRWRLLFFLSYADEFLGRTDDALAAIREARQLQPDMARLAFQEAWVVYHARRWDDALAAFNKVIEEYPVEKDLITDCRFRISNIYVEQGDLEKGEKVLEEVLAGDPENTQANNDLGYLWADHDKNLEKAKTMIEKAVKADPQNPAYLDSLGWVLFKLGDFGGAVENLQKATSLKNGDDATIYDHLGDALEKVGKPEEARKAWEKALELEMKNSNPDDELREKLKKNLGM